MNNDLIKLQINELFESACQDLFAGLNCDVMPVSQDDYDAEDCSLSCIDAGSDELEIKVGLEMPLSVLAMTFPVPNVFQVKEDDLEDWASELSNQLIGRLKTKLLRHKVDINLGLPTSYVGVDVEEVLQSSEHRM